MYKFKQIFLCFLLGSLFACERDPLKKFPSEIQEGVLNTGLQHFSNFEDSFVKKLLKVDVIGKNNLTMVFSEGESQSYRIRFRLLNNFNSKYELQIAKNPFEKLQGSTWSYDAEQQAGVLVWEPSEDFTESKKSVKISILLSIQLKKLGPPNKGSLSSVSRDFTVIVDKRYTPPEVYKVKSEYDSYIRLSDGNFYRDYLLSHLDLSYYDTVFLGNKDKIRKKVDKDFIFYTFSTFKFFSSVDNSDNEFLERVGFGRDFDLFTLTDKSGKEVFKELIPFIQQPYYHAVEKAKDASCVEQKTDFLEKSFCLARLKELTEVDVSTALYVKQYKRPGHIKENYLYYKMESLGLCEIYHKLSYDFIIHKEEWKPKSVCYLSFDSLNQPDSPISEKTSLYVLKEDDSFELADKSKWELSFYKLPGHVKWQLSGHRPILGNIIPVSLIRKKYITSLEFYVKDSNYFSSDPFLIPIEQEQKILPWKIPLHWELAKIEREKETHWKLRYNINLTKLFEKDEYTKLYEFPLSLKPVSVNIVGLSVDLLFSVLPSIKLNYTDSFNPDTDLKISTQVKYSGDLHEWVSSVFSIKTQIKQKYIFPANFKESLLTVFPKKESTDQKNLMDILNIKTPEPTSDYACFPDGKGFFKGNCECSPLSYYEKELEESNEDKEEKKKEAYAESVCSYETHLELNTKYTNNKKQVISAYWKHDYSVPFSVALKSQSADGKQVSDRPLVVNNFYLNEYPLANELKEEFSIHIFFNLKPDINCFSNLDSAVKTCQIKYHLDKAPKGVILSALNKDKYFFQKQGIQADMTCLFGDNSVVANAEECSCGDPKFVVEAVPSGFVSNPEGGGTYVSASERVSLELECSMDKNQQGFIEAVLKTQNPYIYFLDKELKDDTKSTSLKSLKIE